MTTGESVMSTQNESKEWAKLFLEQWNRANQLWNDGVLFHPMTEETKQAYGIMSQSNYTVQQRVDQKRYAEICATWIITNGFVEPHCVAEGK